MQMRVFAVPHNRICLTISQYMKRSCLLMIFSDHFETAPFLISRVGPGSHTLRACRPWADPRRMITDLRVSALLREQDHPSCQ